MQMILRFLFFSTFSVFSFFTFSQTITTGAITGSPFCAGGAVSVPYTITGSFTGGNVFTAQLSNATGTFGAPINIGNVTSTSAGTISATIPLAQVAGTQYRVRVVSSTPAINGSNNGIDLTINSLGIIAPTITGAPFCAGSTFNITNNLSNSCGFGSGNIFTVQLSNAVGGFGTPTTIGTAISLTGGPISVTIPFGTATGTGYRFRVVSSNPAINGANNGADVTINAPVPAGPTVTGSSFCAGSSFNITNNLSNGCIFNSGNIFTVQLSNAVGGFGTPITVGSISSITSGSIPITIPLATTGGLGYRIRVISSSPVSTGVINGVDLTIIAVGLNGPTVAGSPFCVGSTFNITNNLSSVCTFGPTNTFTVQLSNDGFVTNTVIGSVINTSSGGVIPVTIPLAQTAATNYRIRVVASNPGITSANNGADLTISRLLIAPTGIPATLCQGSTFNINNNLSAGTGCSFNAGNNFNVELSDAVGSFTTPTVIGSAANTTAGGTIPVTIPFPTPIGSAYRIRVVGTNPVVTGPQNAAALTVSDFGINAPTFAGTTFCPGQSVTVNYTLLNACAFPNTPSNNIFTAQLSDSFGSFLSPTDIGSVTSNAAGSISTTIPVNAIAGNGYRIRVISSNPSPSGRISPLNAAGVLTINAINLNAPTFAGTTFCPGSTFNVAYTFVSACTFLTGNTFTAQLSDASGSFASATTIGTANVTTAGNISVTIPTNTPAGTLYRIRVVSTSPSITSPLNASNITISSYGVNAPTITGGTTTFCQGQAFTVNYTIQNGCGFPAGNVFTVQLSNAVGSFASPISLGSVTAIGSGAISANIGSPAAGAAYRIRVVSSLPSGGVIGADNGIDLAVNVSAGNPSVFGTAAWNAYVYSGTSLSSLPSGISSNIYLGAYIENNLSFNTRNRWADTAGPNAADASQGAGNAYQGCPKPGTAGQSYSVSFKRTNIPCGYYQIDIPAHDDDVRLFINGTQQFVHVGCCDSHTNVWTGFINPAATVEFQFLNGGGPGFLQVAIVAAPNPLIVSPNIVQCSAPTTPGTLTVSSALPLSYAWTPTTGLTPASGIGANVTAAPSSTTTYTVTGTDATTGCTVTGTTTVTVSNATPTIITTNTIPTICSGVNASVLTASGASNYSWAPATGLSATTGSVVTANPPSSTTYTVTGNNGCTGAANTATANVSVNVQIIPSTPPATGPTSFGNNAWNVFAHYNNTTYSNLYGYYTENNLSFNTTTRWANGAGPSVANAASGLAYSGCSFVAPAVSTNYSMSFRRTNFTCGYYQIDINNQDDFLTLLIDGVQVFQRNSNTGTLQSNVWTGFLGSLSTVEFQFINNAGPGQLQVTFSASPNSPQTLSPDATICAGTNSGLTVTAAAYPTATYTWSVSPAEPTITLVPNNTVSNPFFQTTGSTPAGPYTVTNILTDAGGTGCTASATRIIIVDPLPNTMVTPTSATITCPTASVVLTASGANTYTWSPAAGLSATTGFSVIANPATTTPYTVTGSNNCAVNSASTTITVIPLPAITIFPSGTWNVYGFDSQTIGTNYQGYYTENGSGPTGLNFDTRTRWTSGGAPSTANATNGAAWQGCAMGATNISISAKRTGFTCGVYQLDVPAHDDDFYLLVNGVQVARHNGCCDTHANVWTGVLNATSTVEFQMQQGGGGSYLQVAFTLIAQPAGTSVWLGGTNNDWFTASNWCTGIPTSTTDALIPAAGPQNMPVINNTGAVARNITINPSIPASGGTVVTPLIPAASLTTNAFNLDVNGNWINNGTYTANTGTVSFVGTGLGNTVSTNLTQTFNNIVLNKNNGIIFSTGTSQISGAMTFTNGLVTQSGIFRFLNGSSAAGANNNSYMIGIVTKVGNNAFTFPVGASNLYRPIAISAPAVVTDTYTAQYIASSALGTFPNSARAATLDHVSAAEYWLLNRTVGISTVNVTLSWASNSGGVGNLSSLRVAAWNGSLWSDQGNTATSGTTTAGTVTSGVSTVYGPYTLATIDNSNPLPVQLIAFNCRLTSSNFVELKWSTASELNSDFFNVERSADGKNFTSIGTVKSAGTTNVKREYAFLDEKTLGGTVYYRLRQVDLDKASVLYDVCSVEMPTDENVTIKLYPNPTNGNTYFNLNGKDFNSLSIVNNLGQEINCSYMVETSRVTIDTKGLASGLYIVSVVVDQKLTKIKLIVQG